MTVEFREATAADEAAVIALWHACDLARPWNDPTADFRRALGYPGAAVMMAVDDRVAVGTAMTGFDGHRGWIYYLAVLPDRRGAGVARGLIAACEAWLAVLGCPKVELMVRDGNPATGLYERLGWDDQEVRVFARWLDDRGR